MQKALFPVFLFLGFGVYSISSIEARADSTIYVGVLEDFNAFDKSSDISEAHVRVAFQKTGKDWVPMKTDFNTQAALAGAAKYYPDTVDWTVVFDGKSIGNIKSTNPGSPGLYGNVGIQTITSDSKNVPKVSLGASDFVNLEGTAKIRPLILVSAPNFKDPEEWKRTSLSEVENAAAIKEFRQRFPTMEQCDQPEQQPVHKISYADNEIVLIKAYRSNKGEVIYGQRLSDKRSICGFYDDPNFYSYWFLLKTDGTIRLLDSRITPMDAADLDGEGRSEWVFQTSRAEDEDGYELFYDDFSKKAYFHWFYH